MQNDYSIPVIHDGDHGGDDFITSLILLNCSDFFDLKGITVTDGNVKASLCAQNALHAIDFSKTSRDVPVHLNNKKFFITKAKEDDNAFSSNGLGGITFPESRRILGKENAVDWIANTLNKSSAKITILATGPLTNIALLLKKHPKSCNNIKKLVVMGGGDKVSGNIKPYAEFNFYKDPEAANYVLSSKIPILLHTLDSNHQLSFNPERQSAVKNLEPHKKYGEILCKMMRIVEDLDMKAFNSDGAFIHDVHTALSMIKPEYYLSQKIIAHVKGSDTNEPGRLVVNRKDNQSNLAMVQKMLDPDKVFNLLLNCLKK